VYNEIVFARTASIPDEQYGKIQPVFSSGSMLMTGDIMLGRTVERIIDENDFTHPFVGITPVIASHDVVVGNFEASIPKKHKVTPPFGMRFSVREEFMGELKALGFDILSLANNHAFDFGVSGYKNTLTECGEASLVCVGYPSSVSTSSLYVVEVGDVRLGIIFLHALFSKPTAGELEPLLRALEEKSDAQIAYVHWGEEYQKKHSSAQETLAHLLIDNGVDAVVGHHPHVIQDIEKYRDKPIFYSLGNLIFDQYFSEVVQEGYLLSINPGKHTLTYSLIPYVSTSTPSQPHLMSEGMKLEFAHEMLPPTHFTDSEIAAQTFTVKRD
jgi:poly-gamma-glutamate synthesis protein (capsule biosynthesis protein)